MSIRWSGPYFWERFLHYLMGTSIHILEVIASRSKYVVVHLVPHSCLDMFSLNLADKQNIVVLRDFHVVRAIHRAVLLT